MKSGGVLSVGVAVGFFLGVLGAAFPPPARAAWVNSTGTQFQVGGKLTEIVPTAGTGFVDPTCGSQGGTSLALVRGLKLAGVDPLLYPLVLVVSCLDNGGSATIRSRLSFINPVSVPTTAGTLLAGTVVKQVLTTAVPSNGWAHLVHRPDKGDLLGCGSDGTLYTIDYSQTNTTTDGTATQLPQVATSCAGLAWDAEADMIYQGLTVSGGNKIGRVVRFKDGTATIDKDFPNLPCPANGLAISGGVLLMSCAGLVNNTLVIQRLDKSTGANLGLYPSLSLPVPGTTVTGFLGLTALNNDPGLGDLACDPVTFQKNAAGRDLFRDAVWSRRGANGNGVAAVEFPSFTCGLPSNSVVGGFSPLAPGLSTGTAASPGQLPLAACFDSSGIVIDSDGDGLPDCWETNLGGSGPDIGGGIDFDGDGTQDLKLCASVNTNGDGVTLTPECAVPNHKDLFVEVDYMQGKKPDPQALSQTQSVTTVGVKSVREAFAAAPPGNPDGTNGIRLHIQVDEQVTFTNLANATTSLVTYIALTPCTGPASSAPNPPGPSQAADFDTIKAANFGTAAERGIADPVQRAKMLNAKRLAFRYVLFANNLVGNPNGGSSSSGCSEVGGDDAVVTLGSFTNGVGTTDQQAGTFMHEFGHLLGFQHGGEDNVNCKPNYRSVMSYSRQFAGSPIAARRLDYSRSEDLDLNEGSLNECSGIGSDSSLGPIQIPGSSPPTYYFSSADQIAFGPGAWSLATPWPLRTASIDACTTASPGPAPINWNRQNVQGKTYQTPPQTLATGDINAGSTAGCDGSGTALFGSNDWANVLYRASAAIDFAGGARSGTPFPPGTTSEMTKEDETTFFLATDSDGNGIGDGQDCGTAVAGQTTSLVDANAVAVPIAVDPKTHGFAPSGKAFLGSTPPTLDDFAYTGTDGSGFTGVTGVDASLPTGTTVLATLLCPLHQCGILPDGTPFLCNTHRIDIKPSAPLPKIISLGAEANVTIAIFSEVNWNAPAEIKVDQQSLAQYPLTFTIETVVENVKTNKNGSGTCSISDVADPVTGKKDTIKDLKCQFQTSGLPTGTHFGVVSGFFLDPLTNQFTAFSARQEVTILP
jgi:hypothetical protein